MKLFFVIAFLLVFITASSQDKPNFKLVENALLHKLDISGIHISQDGKLWFGTNEGLASFDGNDVKIYSLQTSNDLVPDRITSFAEDKQHNIWVYTTGKKLVRFSPITGKYIEVDFLKNDSLKASAGFGKLYFDKEGNLWLGSNRGFFIYDVSTGRYEHYNLKPHDPASWADKYQNTVYDFGEDAHDPEKMWIGSYGLGLLSFNKTSKNLSYRFSAEEPKLNEQKCLLTQFHVADSVIWFGNWGMGMGRYNIRTGKYRFFGGNNSLLRQEYVFSHIVRKLTPKSPDEYYIALGDSTPAIFNTRTLSYSYIDNEALRQTIDRTTDIAEDAQGNVWCIKGGRLYAASSSSQIFAPLYVSALKRYTYRSPNILMKMLWDSLHQTYYAAIDQGDGIAVYDQQLRYIKTIPVPFEQNRGGLSFALDLEQDETGRLWVLGEKLYAYDSVSKSMIPASEKFKSISLFNQPFQAITIAEGQLVLQTKKRELIFLNPRTWQSKTVQLPSLTQKPIVEYHARKLLFDAKHSIIYACDGDAIFRYNIEENRFRVIEVSADKSTPLPKVNVSTYALDDDGNLWVGSRGIFIFEPKSLRLIRTLNRENGLTDNVNINLLQGPKNYMFFFTPHGGNLFSIVDSTITHFDLSNGFPSDFPQGYSFANGKLFFSPGAGAQNGYAEMLSLLSLQKTITPYLSGLKITNDDFLADTVPQSLSTIRLQHDENSIALSFSSTEFAFPDKVEYAYKLDGQDKEWSYTNYLNRSIIYTNLKPGTYIFHVKSRLLGGKWSEMRPLTITIVPAFWQTMWFQILLAILLATLIYLFVQQRLKSERKKAALNQQHRSQLAELEADALRAQMNPHFIFNCLNSIKALIQQNKNEAAISYLTTFSKLIRTLFQNAGKREISLHEELETCKLYTQLEALRFGDRIRFSFDVDNKLDLKDVFVPALIVQPFIENAIWHGLVPKKEGGKVKVLVQQTDGKVECIIDDEGIGRELSQQFKDDQLASHQSKGIALTQSRLQLDRIIYHRDDNIEVIDKKNSDGQAAGTKVILSFKNEKE